MPSKAISEITNINRPLTDCSMLRQDMKIRFADLEANHHFYNRQNNKWRFQSVCFSCIFPLKCCCCCFLVILLDVMSLHSLTVSHILSLTPMLCCFLYTVDYLGDDKMNTHFKSSLANVITSMRLHCKSEVLPERGKRFLLFIFFVRYFNVMLAYC